MRGYSLALPVATDPNDGFKLLKYLQNVALQNLKMVLYVEPGEMVWDIDFGVGIKKYLFEQNTNFARQQIKTRITNQVSKYLPYINILNLDINAISENDEIVETSNFLKVIIVFNVPGLETMTFEDTIIAGSGTPTSI